MPEEKVRPPYVKFEMRSVEDREASIAAGHYVGKDVVFAIVTPAGTRDRLEREATDWLLNVEEGVKQERLPPDWLPIYRKALEDFKESRDTPEFGTPINNWPGASVSQVKMLLDINVRTVEDLAAANEEVMSRLGMGARALKAKAQAWLDQANDTGKAAEELDAMRVEVATLRERDKAREAEFEKMKNQLAALTAKEEA